jgi:hypothetical protein
MAVLKGSIPISGTASIAFTNDAEGLFLIVGKWFVEVTKGKLIVRGAESPEVLLTVDI